MSIPIFIPGKLLNDLLLIQKMEHKIRLIKLRRASHLKINKMTNSKCHPSYGNGFGIKRLPGKITVP